MTATAHGLVGAAIVSRSPNLFGLLLAFLSHFPLDFIPHWDTLTNGKKHTKVFCVFATGIDVLFCLSLVYYLFGKILSSPLLLLAVLFSQLPDWLSAPYYFFGITFFPFRFALKFQQKFHHKLDLPFGLITQILTIISIFILLKIIPLY